MNNKKLPMRNGVGVIILNKNNQVFVAKRKDNQVDRWQMPQGGVNSGESYLSAMKRELFEETSIKSIELLKEIDGFFEYELPDNLVGIIWRGKFKGQKQKWFIVKFIGNEKEINLKTKYPEFVDWKWIMPDELPNVIVDFKRNLYLSLLVKLKELID
jgi:putative (di)nucleoside polyphosphate hydrolase|tara:strand:- start:143 stop:613 length:471 start_codon:yes stop_codon:yes gene_type:complete